MIRSVLLKYGKLSIVVLITALGLVNFGFVNSLDEQEMISWSNKCLSQSFDPEGEQKLKKWELVLTNDSFIRLRKTYVSGKQEYFSFNLHRFSDMSYLGTTSAGMLQFKTIADDIIVQTYNDRKGNVDSMATVLNIPVRNMEPERLDSLRSTLIYFKLKQL
jgi:hypothetical protein